MLARATSSTFSGLALSMWPRGQDQVPKKTLTLEKIEYQRFLLADSWHNCCGYFSTYYTVLPHSDILAPSRIYAELFDPKASPTAASPRTCEAVVLCSRMQASSSFQGLSYSCSSIKP